MEKRSSGIEIFLISRDGEQERTDEIIHEAEIIGRIDGEIHKFYCVLADLEAMTLGNLKSRGTNPSFSKIRKTGDNEFNVNLSFGKGLIEKPQKCESNKKLTSKEVFNSVEILNANAFLHKKSDYLQNTNSYKHRCPHRLSCKRSRRIRDNIHRVH